MAKKSNNALEIAVVVLLIYLSFLVIKYLAKTVWFIGGFCRGFVEGMYTEARLFKAD